MADNGWGFLNNAGKSSNYYGADGSWGYTNEDGSGSYYGADGSFVYSDPKPANSSYSSCSSCSYASSDDSSSGLGILAGIALVGAAIWGISKLLK